MLKRRHLLEYLQISHAEDTIHIEIVHLLLFKITKMVSQTKICFVHSSITHK